MKRTRDTGSVNKLAAAVVSVPLMPEPVMEFFRATGRIGGSAKTEAKSKAARRNGKLGGRLGGRPRNQQEALPESEVLATIQGSKPAHPACAIKIFREPKSLT